MCSDSLMFIVVNLGFSYNCWCTLFLIFFLKQAIGRLLASKNHMEEINGIIKEKTSRLSIIYEYEDNGKGFIEANIRSV